MNPEKPILRLVYCADEYDLYPVRWEEMMFRDPGGYGMRRSVEAGELQRCRSASNNEFLFPVSIREVLYTSGTTPSGRTIVEMENWIYETKLDPESVVIGGEMSDSLFTLSPLEAGLYNDLDNTPKPPGPDYVPVCRVWNLAQWASEVAAASGLSIEEALDFADKCFSSIRIEVYPKDFDKDAVDRLMPFAKNFSRSQCALWHWAVHARWTHRFLTWRSRRQARSCRRHHGETRPPIPPSPSQARR